MNNINNWINCNRDLCDNIDENIQIDIFSKLSKIVPYDIDEKINDWFNRKTKLSKNHDIKVADSYLKLKNATKSKIYFSSDYEFEFYDITQDNINNLRGETIFKVNFFNIINQLKIYFPNDISIKIMFEGKSRRDKQILRINACYKHDVYIVFENNDNFFDMGLEFFEMIHDRIRDNDKKIKSEQLLDTFSIYDERDDRIKDYTKKILVEMFTIICSLTENKYLLAKINYFSMDDNENIGNINELSNVFNFIMDAANSGKFNLYELHRNLRVYDSETGEEYDFDDFKRFIKFILKIKIKFNDENIYDYDLLDLLIYKIPFDNSDNIKKYLQVYKKFTNLVLHTSWLIIKYYKKKNEIKNNIPDFIWNFLRNHIMNISNTSVMRNLNNILIR